MQSQVVTGIPKAAAPVPNGELVFLIVEDDPDDYLLLERTVKKAKPSARVCWARNAGEGLEWLDRPAAEFLTICLVVDIQLPDMSGFELARRAKEYDRPNLKVAVMTGNPDPKLRDKAFQCGAEAFFFKPTEHSQLAEIVRELTELAAADVPGMGQLS